MAKYPRYRKYSRRRRSRWISTLIDIGPNDFVLSTPEDWNFTEFTLITNPDYSNTLTGNLYTIKNVEVAINFDTKPTTSFQDDTGIENLQFYIMYAPQQMPIYQDYAIKHPENILAYRYYGEPGKEAPGDTAQMDLTGPIKIKTRLARKLHAGDRIILFIRAANTTNSTTVKAQYGGLCRFWTKAN